MDVCANFCKKTVSHLNFQQFGALYPHTSPELILDIWHRSVENRDVIPLSFLIGTPYEPDFTNSILLIEEVRTEPYKLDCKLSQLSQAGIFDRISGLIFGIFKDCNAKYFPDRDGSEEDVIQEWSEKLSVPCIKDFPYGHIDRRCVLPIGAEIILDASQCHVIIK